MNIVAYIVAVVLIVFTIGIFSFSRRLFCYSLIIVYPVIAQTVRFDLPIPGLTMNMPMLYGIVVFLLTLLIFLLNWRPERTRILAIGFVCYCLGTAMFSLSPFSTMKSSLKIGTWVLLFPVSASLIREKRHLLILSDLTLVAAMIICISIALAKFGLYGRITDYGSGVSVGVGGYYSQSGIAAALALCFPLLLLKGILGRHRGLYCVGAAFSSGGLLWTYVRGPLVALSASAVYLLYLIRRHKLSTIWLKASAVLVFFCVLLGVFYLSNPETAFVRWSEELRLIEEGRFDKVGSGRVGGLMFFGQYFAKNTSWGQKLFGLGYGTTGMINPSGKIAHNAFVQILLGCGLVGVSIFVTYLIVLFRMLKRTVKDPEIGEDRFFGALALMSFGMLCLLLFRGSGAEVFPYYLPAIQIGSTVGYFRRRMDER